MAQCVGHKITNLALNIYENGDEAIGRHRDKMIEGKISLGSTIATCSLLRTREMVLTKDYEVDGKKKCVAAQLEAGSLLMMCKDTQALLQHEIKKDSSINTRRISITGRFILPMTPEEKKKWEEGRSLGVAAIKGELMSMKAKLKKQIEESTKLRTEVKRLREEVEKQKRAVEAKTQIIISLKGSQNQEVKSVSGREIKVGVGGDGGGDKVCSYFKIHRVCRFGTSCRFTHEDMDLKSKPATSSQQTNVRGIGSGRGSGDSVCNFFRNYGSCRFGVTCRFSHEIDKDSKTRPPATNHDIVCNFFRSYGSCRFGVTCRFSHEIDKDSKTRAPANHQYVRAQPKWEEVDPRSYRTNVLIVKGLSKVQEPSLEWIQQQLAETEVIRAMKNVQKISQFTTLMGTVLTRIELKDEQSVTDVLRERKTLRNEHEGKYRNFSIFAHRPKFIRDKFPRPIQRFTPLRDLELERDSNPYQLPNPSHPYPTQHLNWVPRTYRPRS